MYKCKSKILLGQKYLKEKYQFGANLFVLPWPSGGLNNVPGSIIITPLGVWCSQNYEVWQKLINQYLSIYDLSRLKNVIKCQNPKGGWQKYLFD